MMINMGIGDNFGELLTEAMRSIAWYRGDMDAARSRMYQEFPDMTGEMSEKILNGQMKFQTDEDGVHVVVVNDNWTPPNWKEITERLFGMTTGDVDKYFEKKWGFKEHQTVIIKELAEEAYDYLYDDKKDCHDAYLKMMDEIVRVEKTVNRYRYGSLLSHPMFRDLDPEPCTNVEGEYNGWLSPTGMFYRCGKYTHDSLANDLDTDNGTKGLERKGWYRLSGGEWDNYSDRGLNKPTNKQMDFIEKWQKVNEKEKYAINGFEMTYEGFLEYVYEDWDKC